MTDDTLYRLKDYYMNRSKVMQRNDYISMYNFIHENSDIVLELLHKIIDSKYEKFEKNI